MRRLFPERLLLALCLAFLARNANAGLYNPAEPMPFSIQPDGTASELSFGSQFGGQFPLLLTTRTNIADSRPSRTENPDRKAVLDRVAQLKARQNLSVAEKAGLGADLLRLGQLDEAINLLAPGTRERSPDFRILANMAHIHAERGEWREARNIHELALEIGFPEEMTGITPEQQRWLQKVERESYRAWLRIHQERSRSTQDVAQEDVFPLFPVRWVNEQGVYEPGQLAAVERAKLPPDAIAIVQQLLLWSPSATELYWLLGELYAAKGRLREAELIFNQCVDGRQYSNRNLFMEHREAIRMAVAKLPPESQTDDLVLGGATPGATKIDVEQFLPSKERALVLGLIFGAFTFVLIFLQVRSLRRRRSANR